MNRRMTFLTKKTMERTINKLFYLLILCMAPLAHPFAQQTYTLDECIELALANNLSLKTAANSLQMAEEDKKSAFTNFFPNISATGGGLIANKGLFEMEIQPGALMSMADDGIIGSVTASLPVFAGGQIVNSNKLADVGLESQRLQYGLSENEVRLKTENYFWQVVMLKEKLWTLHTVEEYLQQLVSDVQAAVDAGVVNRNDLLMAQLRMNEQRSNRLNLENALLLSRSLLAQHMGLGIDSVEVATDMAEVLPSDPSELFSLPEDALPQTREYLLLQQNLKASKLQKKLAVGKNLPTLAIGGGFVYENLMDRDHSFWMGFATLSIPLTDWWSGTHNIRKQKLAVRNAENQLSDQSELLMIKMQQTWNDLRNAYLQVGIALNSIEQSSENLRLQTDYYHAGICTMGDLLEAQTLYQQSRDQYVEAFARYEVKKREYLQATGR